jgi:Peptidase family M28
MAWLDLDKLFEQAQSKDFKPVELSVRLQAHVASQVRPFVSRDVLAALPSTGPGATQAVLYTAHYDHLSVDPGMDGHNIYNGAVDNATGCGVLFELVSAIMVADDQNTATHDCVRGSYRGGARVGSEYLAKHSPVMLGRISLDMNFDALVPIGDPEEVEVWGANAERFILQLKERREPSALQFARPEAGFCTVRSVSPWRGRDPLFFDFRRFEVQRT